MFVVRTIFRTTSDLARKKSYRLHSRTSDKLPACASVIECEGMSPFVGFCGGILTVA